MDRNDYESGTIAKLSTTKWLYLRNASAACSRPSRRRAAHHGPAGARTPTRHAAKRRSNPRRGAADGCVGSALFVRKRLREPTSLVRPRAPQPASNVRAIRGRPLWPPTLVRARMAWMDARFVGEAETQGAAMASRRHGAPLRARRRRRPEPVTEQGRRSGTDPNATALPTRMTERSNFERKRSATQYWPRLGGGLRCKATCGQGNPCGGATKA